MSSQFHPYHMVSTSPWPLIASMNTLSLVSSLLFWFNMDMTYPLSASLINSSLTAFLWWKDTTREAHLEGNHSSKTVSGLKIGMLLFIISEVFFFISFFWTFFHSSLTPTHYLGSLWPPSFIDPFNPTQIPLLNTVILLSSGASLTWSHHSMLTSKFNKAKLSLLTTVLLGIYFSLLQGFEYLEATFWFSNSTYGSTFFIATGFHGLHVLIGSTFLIVCLTRMKNYQLSSFHHFGFEAAAWYWHFVDVVWLFLYITIYWWGS